MLSRAFVSTVPFEKQMKTYWKTAKKRQKPPKAAKNCKKAAKHTAGSSRKQLATVDPPSFFLSFDFFRNKLARPS